MSCSIPPTSLRCLAPKVGSVSRSAVHTCVSNNSPIATDGVIADGIVFLLEVNYFLGKLLMAALVLPCRFTKALAGDSHHSAIVSQSPKFRNIVCGNFKLGVKN